MSLMLEHKQGLIAGDGTLPVKMAQYAKENGFEVVCISFSKDNLSKLKKYCSKVYSCHPGEINKIEKILKDEEIKQAYRPYDWKNGRMHLPMDEWEHLLQKIQEKGYSYT